MTDILGLEAAGEISEIGPGCNQRWKVGDRVMALLAGQIFKHSLRDLAVGYQSDISLIH